MNKRLLIIIIAIGILCASGVNASIIGSYTVTYGEYYSSSVKADWAANLWVSDDPAFPKTTLFNGEDLIPFDHTGIDIFSNAGKTFWIASDADDPEYSSVVAQLTDGVPDYLWISIGVPGGGGVGLPVPINRLLSRPNNFGINDLKGYTIGRIGLNITSALHTVDYSKTYPHTYSMSVTCLIDDAVPEPASLLAMVLGLGMLCMAGLNIKGHKIGRTY